MVFWLAAIALTFAASLAVLIPLTRKPSTASSDAAHDLTVYRDQLAEVERDRDRGAIGGPEAELAKAEIARRIIRLDGEKTPEGTPVRSTSRVLTSIAVLSIPLVSWGFYSLIGSPDLPSQPLAARMEKAPNEATPEELVARAEQALAHNPDDPRGWTVLAPIYLRMNRPADALTAYRNAIRLAGEDADKLSGLGEALVIVSGGVVTREAEDAFKRALALTPDFPKARFFLAMGMAQEGKTAEAAQAWQAIVETAPADSPWREAARNAAAQVQTAQTQPGPTREAAEAVSKQPPAEQMAMIEQMVSGLDEKLRAEPNDPEGWKRLVRSYHVLGREDAARDALKRALAALGADTEAGRGVTSFAAEQGIGQTQ